MPIDPYVGGTGKPSKKKKGRNPGKWVKVNGIWVRRTSRKKLADILGGGKGMGGGNTDASRDISRAAAGRQRDLKATDRILRDREAARGNDRALKNTIRDKQKADNRAFNRRPNLARNRGVVNSKFRQVNRMQRRVQRKDNALDQLFSQLMGAVNMGEPNFDFESILNKNLKAINQAYNAERNALNRGDKRAKQDTRQNRQALETMYGALARTYTKEAGRENKRSQRQEKQVAQIFNQQGKVAERTTDRLQSEQADLMSKLGIEDAAMDVIPEGTAILNKELSGIRKQKSQARNVEEQRGNIQERYLRRESGLARQEGNQRSADQLDALQDFLFQSNNDRKSIAARRQMALAEAEGQLSGQFGEMQQAHEDAVWERLMDVAGFKLDVDKTRAGNRQANQALRLDRQGLQLDRQNSAFDRKDSQFDNLMELRKLAQQQREFAAGQMEDADDDEILGPLQPVNNLFQKVAPRRSSKLWQVFNNVTRSPQVRSGKFKGPDGSLISMTPEQAAYMAEQQGSRQGLNNTEKHLLRLAVLQYFG